ncbi:hypothetical protein P280DRAFT_394869 [Massarina eburnea CBS 473.64]|uniref:UspA domain-containing protein n=1 Tax=Massarina eburnea CBS 473.64 TaxID=1395130 RepID=A0A6A6S8N9_9PLEO|nr:hypothetical protein P280DRAFT_394869 [Massarina eburnea CBS 473.64]
MSLESALDEEMREVMALLEGKKKAPARRRGNESSHATPRTQSPSSATSPMRSMLDIDGQTAPASSRGSVPPSPLSPPGSARPRNPESAYKFEMLPTIEAHAMPKRVTQGGKKNSSHTNTNTSSNNKPRAMSSVYGDASDMMGSPRDAARHNSLGGLLAKGNAGSPGPGRSQSPGGRRLNSNAMNLMPTPNKYVTNSGRVIDMNAAYRRLSDAALLRSGGGLSSLPVRKGSDPTKGETLAPGGGVRLATDDFLDDEAAVESSENETEDEYGDGWEAGKRRGRRRTRPDGDGDRVPGSLLAAAEAERKDVSEVYKVRSLLEPNISVTGPDGATLSGEKMSNKKHGVHPHTSFDQGNGLSSAYNSDTEADLSDLKSAQQLSMSISPIQSSPEAHRCVRQVIRGKYGKFQDDAEKGLRRQRVYLVATDISEEAAYALEWTIGTVLRDGDTLLAVYAVDEETGIGGSDAASGGATAQQESDSLKKVLSNKNLSGDGPGPSPLANSMVAADVDVEAMGPAEKARYQACVEVSDRCLKLLRKTRLQVRVVVEVFHCKSPKHMITEVIDFLEPTLVILGSRGRNALKGVLLGSFSNYLVTKSSVPVMVARKRLRKHSKYKRKNLRLSNVISSPNGRLANAKVD